MAGPTNKRKAPTSDFKRIKAKVGKKAAKPANVTDTSFKAASVSVKNQAVDLNSQDVKLLSERGRSIQDLSTQLNHPAAAVRTSAIRGLSNVVESHAESVKAHLPVLLPAVAKCCVDEDDNVRQLGLAVLRKILTSCEEQVLRPFLVLLTAYVTSALNSLDRSTRLDGGRAVDILSMALPSLMGSQAERLLPAFVGLLADYHRQRRPDTAATAAPKSKRKSKSGLNENGRHVILQSLVSLLRTIPEENNEDSTRSRFVDHKPDLVFVSGGRTVNALLIAGREKCSVRPIQSISQLSSFVEGNLDTSLSEDKGDLSVAVANDIVSKLRDISMELSQRGGTEGSRGGIILSAMDIEELSLLNSAIRLFWNAFCLDMIRRDVYPKQVTSLRKGFIKLLSLTMESFPVWQQSSNAELATKCAIVNADICATLMDIGGYLEADSKEINWTKKVLDYLFPRLESKDKVPFQDDTIVNVLSKLLLLRNNATEFSLSEKTRCKVLKKVCEIFFAETKDSDFARLSSSRRASTLILAMLKTENYILGGGRLYDASLQMALRALPYHLKAWRGDFLPESREVLSALQGVSRRLDPESQYDQEILDCLRNDMSLLFEVPKRSNRQKKRPRISAVFELYSTEMQLQTLGLLVMIRSPSEATVNGLSYICSRCAADDTEGIVSDTIADAILFAVHSIRRSMSMQAYLSFVIRSIGIDMLEVSRKVEEDRVPQEKSMAELEGGEVVELSSWAQSIPDGEYRDQRPTEIRIDLKTAKASEASVRRASRSCILSGSAKVLSMIYPVINEWLAGMSPASGLHPSQKATRFRAACSLCAMLALDMEASLPIVASNLARNLLTATCNLFALCFSRGSSDHDLMEAFEYLMQPMFALMKTDSKLIELLFEMASARICDQDADASSYMEALLWLVRDTKLAAALREVAATLKRCSESIEGNIGDNSSLERQTWSFRTAVEILIGNTNDDYSNI